MKDGFYIYRDGNSYEFFQILDEYLYTHKRGVYNILDDNPYQKKCKPHMFGPITAAATWLKDNAKKIRKVTETDIFVEMI
jgi:hypothetical protein